MMQVKFTCCRCSSIGKTETGAFVQEIAVAAAATNLSFSFSWDNSSKEHEMRRAPRAPTKRWGEHWKPERNDIS
jgi:hypothetical protein